MDLLGQKQEGQDADTWGNWGKIECLWWTNLVTKQAENWTKGCEDDTRMTKSTCWLKTIGSWLFHWLKTLIESKNYVFSRKWHQLNKMNISLSYICPKSARLYLQTRPKTNGKVLGPFKSIHDRNTVFNICLCIKDHF